jgi:hypothetical protein
VCEQQRLGEGRVDNVECLVGLERAGFGILVQADFGECATEALEGEEDGGSGDGGDFDGDGGPVGEEAGLGFAEVWSSYRC